MGKNRQQLLEILSQMSNDELALVLATGLNCSKCPVMPTYYKNNGEKTTGLPVG